MSEPDNNAVPPLEAAYQSTVVPVTVAAFKVTVPVPHLLVSLPVGADGTALIVATATERVEAQLPVPMAAT